MTIGPVHLHEEGSARDAVGMLRAAGIDALMIAGASDLDDLGPDTTPSLALVESASLPKAELAQCLRRCSDLRLPVIAFVEEHRVSDLDPTLGLNDFILLPLRTEEVVARSRWVLNRIGKLGGDEVIRIHDMQINPASYEVAVRGQRVNLRFKEYELLLLMATNPGRVFSREALLERIWGYDYLGGTRTVDVHIRRLRSKIEDADHQFIETVWMVGYRFKAPD